MVVRSDLIAASVYSRKLPWSCSSNSSLRERRGSEVSAPEQERLPTPLVGIELRGDKADAPQDGPQFCTTHDRGVGSPCSRCIGRRRRRVGPLLGQSDKPPLTDLGNNHRPMVENGEVGEDHGQQRLSHLDIGGDGWLRGRISNDPGRKLAGLEAAATSTTPLA
jgi:hypothetical protein